MNTLKSLNQLAINQKGETLIKNYDPITVDNSETIANSIAETKYKNKVSKIIYDIGSEKQSLYRDLFFPIKNQLDDNQFRQKILFKLQRIINSECADAPFKIYVDSNARIMKHQNNGYSLWINISFLLKNGSFETWKQAFSWFTNYQIDINYRDKNSRLNQNHYLITAAENIILNINKKMFYDPKITKKGSFLLNYIQGKLESISPDLTITPRWQNMYLELEKVDFQVHVYFNGNWIFDAAIEENKSSIQYAGKAVDKQNQNQTINPTDFISLEQLKSQFEMIQARFQRSFQNVWDENDTIGDIIKSISYLWFNLFGKKIANIISIKAEQFPVTHPLKWLFNNQGQVSFKIKISTFNLTWIIDLTNTGMICIKQVNMIDKITQKMSSISLKNRFFEQAKNLYWIVVQELNEVSYVIKIHSKWNNLYLKTKDVDLYMIVTVNNHWICDIQYYLKIFGDYWIFSFFGDRQDEKIKIKDEL